jgi:hypothetical protein
LGLVSIATYLAGIVVLPEYKTFLPRLHKLKAMEWQLSPRRHFQAGRRPSSTAWQATVVCSLARKIGTSLRQRSEAKGQRGWKAQPGGGLIGLGTSPATEARWDPIFARSGTESNSILV